MVSYSLVTKKVSRAVDLPLVMLKSTLIYDGKCNFCIRCIGRLKHLTEDRVEYLASKEVFDRFPKISSGDFERSIQWVDTEGKMFEGAEAVFRVLACAPGKTWPLWIYQNISGFAFLPEWAYQAVSRNRKIFGAIS